MTRFILDSGDPEEYYAIKKLLTKHDKELWGGTTNPTLIAKKLSDRKVSAQEAFNLQKEIIQEILKIVPGVVSAEVYSDLETEASEMIVQGREIASWHERIAVKLPTTSEGFKARTALRKENILTNNTLVFSQQQIYAICLHERLIVKELGEREGEYPPFISPFVGRLDDQGEDGLKLVENGMEIKNNFKEKLWMLEASVRSVYHLIKGLELKTELMTIPAKIFYEWLESKDNPQPEKDLVKPELWIPPQTLTQIQSLEEFQKNLEEKTLNISHPLTEKGLLRFAKDWQNILQ